jgi:hypothetical protein
MPTFTGEAARTFDPVPEGDYVLRIEKINLDVVGQKAKNAGAEMWRIQYAIEGTDKNVFDNLVFVPKSFWRISNWWRAIGNKLVPGQQIDTGEPEDHLGKPVEAHLSIREYNGIKDNQIDYFIEPRPDGTKGAPLVVVPSADDEPSDIPF